MIMMTMIWNKNESSQMRFWGEVTSSYKNKIITSTHFSKYFISKFTY